MITIWTNEFIYEIHVTQMKKKKPTKVQCRLNTNIGESLALILTGTEVGRLRQLFAIACIEHG